MGAKESVLRRLRRYSGTDWLAGKVGDLEGHVAGLEATVADHERQLRIRTVMEWIALATVPEDALVSVIMPTRDRAPFVRRAYESLVAQTYEHWEVLVVDDGSADDTQGVVEAIDDERVRLYTAAGVGACGARNVGLDHVKGELVAYLDDDNLAHPDWLKAVVWAFGQRPDVDVLYAGFVIDDPLRVEGRDRGGLPLLVWEPYDHSKVSDAMVSDMSAIAHRADLHGARFDESLREMGDWEFLLQVTKEKPPLALPFLACSYMTDAPGRLTRGPTFDADLATVRERHRR